MPSPSLMNDGVAIAPTAVAEEESTQDPSRSDGFEVLIACLAAGGILGGIVFLGFYLKSKSRDKNVVPTLDLEMANRHKGEDETKEYEVVDERVF